MRLRKRVPVFLASLSALVALSTGGANSDSNNYLAFDVHCHLEIIDQKWVTNVTVSIPGEDPIETQVFFGNGMHEDTMAALVFESLESDIAASEMCLKEVNNGPDRVIINGATITATVGPADKSGEGHIELEFGVDKCGSGPIPPNQLVAQVEIELEPFAGADVLFSGVLIGSDSNGGPLILSGSVVLPESGGLSNAATTLLNALNNAGFTASIGVDNVLLITPGLNTISGFQASLAPVLDLTQPPPSNLWYGMRVDHQLL